MIKEACPFCSTADRPVYSKRYQVRYLAGDHSAERYATSYSRLRKHWCGNGCQFYVRLDIPADTRLKPEKRVLTNCREWVDAFTVRPGIVRLGTTVSDHTDLIHFDPADDHVREKILRPRQPRLSVEKDGAPPVALFARPKKRVNA